MLAYRNSILVEEARWAQCVADCARSAAMSGAVCLVLFSSKSGTSGYDTPEIHPEYTDSPNGTHRYVPNVCGPLVLEGLASQ